jgi:hypothetical protein
MIIKRKIVSIPRDVNFFRRYLLWSLEMMYRPRTFETLKLYPNFVL